MRRQLIVLVLTGVAVLAGCKQNPPLGEQSIPYTGAAAAPQSGTAPPYGREGVVQAVQGITLATPGRGSGSGVSVGGAVGSGGFGIGAGLPLPGFGGGRGGGERPGYGITVAFENGDTVYVTQPAQGPAPAVGARVRVFSDRGVSQVVPIEPR